ncbi:NAD(P)-binding protein [Paramyrothecium foliicola]|nr:NAD(P)-binding protein [Paramyrothecium foliicola]
MYNYQDTMAKQQVLRLTRRTSIQDLRTSEEDIPKPHSHEVLIKIRSIALNFRDFAVATEKYPFPVKDNVVPGSDLAGEVVEIGSQVDDFVVGDRVVASFDLQTLYGAMQDWNHSLGGMFDGVMREYIALPREAVVKLPASTKLGFSQLAALVCTGTTAWNVLYGNVPLKPGQTVLFLGTGGVSVTGLILAKAAGATTIITSSIDEKLAYVQKTYGADHVINYKTHPEWSKEVLRITGGRGADIIMENGGAGTIAESIASVAYGGQIGVIGFLASCPQEKMPDVAGLALSKGAVVRGIMVGSKQQLEDVTRFVTSRNLPVPVEKEFGFSRDEVVAALEYMTSGQHIGKICIKVA